MTNEPQPPQPLEELDTSTSTLTLERPDTREQLDEGDHERFAHYVRKEKILESAMSGDPVIALCGKVWVPGRDPSKFPVCPECQKIYDGIPDDNNDD
ncbi:MAG: DUF3039 domain-containing protein [Candidatus Nanopelagicales bacterium]